MRWLNVEARIIYIYSVNFHYLTDLMNFGIKNFS